MPELEIVRIPALSDNYVWLVHDAASGETMVVDPAQAEPVLAEADARGWKIDAIWNTHWHPDHTGGNAAIKEATGATVIAPAAEAARIPTADRLVGEGDEVRLGDHVATVMEVPAHTAGHIAYYFAGDAVVFVGDTLFAMGCGRLFEGTPAQMFENMQRLAALPGNTRVYCAHEYTRGRSRPRGRGSDGADDDRAGGGDQSVPARRQRRDAC
jgi:hydroxyacylglutathione hydrolase